MAGKINLKTDEAVVEIGVLIQELKSLDKTLSTMSQGSVASFNKMNNSMSGFSSKIKELNQSIDRLSTITKTNSKRLTRNSDEIKRNSDLTKTASKNTRAQTRAMKDNTEALKGERKATDENTESKKREKDSYEQLVAAVNKAKRAAQNLTLEQGLMSQSSDVAISTYRKLQAELDALNGNVKKTKNEFEHLSEATKRAEMEAKNMIATFGRESSEAQTAIARHSELKQKLDETSLTTRKLVGAYDQLAQSTNKAKMTAQNLAVETGRNSAQTKQAVTEYERLKRQLDQATIAQEKHTRAQQKSVQSGRSMMGMFKSLMSSLGFLGLIALIGQTVKSIISLSIRFQSLGYAIEKIAGENFAEIKRSWEFLIELNQKFGAQLSDTTERWLKFRAAAAQSNLSLKETMGIFRSVTKASAVLGLSTEELKGVYLALEQMLSKGKVTTEELRRQLGERLPGAMGIMAKAVGVSVNQLDSMMKKGELLSSYALPRFAKALEEAYGIESLEKVENLATGVGKMAGAWDRFVMTISEGDSAINRAIGGTMTLLTNLLDRATNFLETYEQTANRTSGARFGDKVEADLSKEIEDRLKLSKVVKEQIELLEKEQEEKRKAYFADATIENYDKMMDAEKKLSTYKSQQQESYYKARVKDAELLLIGTEIESEARKEAVMAVIEAEKNLADFRDKKAKEGNILSIERYDKELKKLNEMGATINLMNKGVEKVAQVSGNMINAEMMYKMEELFSKITGAESGSEEMKKLTDEYTEQLELVKQLNELRTPLGGEIDTDEETGYRRKIKLAREYAETNQLFINSLNEQIRLNEKLMQEEKAGLVERADMIEYNREARMLVAKTEEEDQLRALEIWEKNEQTKLDENLRLHQNNAEDLAAQIEQNDKQALENKKEYNERLDLINQERRLKEKQNEEKYDKDWREIVTDRFSFIKQQYVLEQAEQLKALEDKLKTIRKGGNEEKEILFDIRQIQIDYHNLMIENQIKELEYQMKQVKTLGEKAELMRQIAILNASMLPDAEEDYENRTSWGGKGQSIVDPLFAQDFGLATDKAQGFVNEMFGLADAIFEHRISLIDKEIDAETAKYDRLLELAKNDEEETKIIERNKALALEKLEAKKRKEQVKQAKLDKAMKLSQAMSSTALAIINALTVTPWFLGVALAAAAGATGAVQIANIAATPIPSFAKGGTMENDGKALINDGGKQEYVQRGQEIMATGKTNAIVDLKKGDIVHKDFETLKRKSMILSLMSGGGSISEKELNLAFGIKEEIKEGFKKARVESKVTVLNQTNNYREKMSLWGNN